MNGDVGGWSVFYAFDGHFFDNITTQAQRASNWKHWEAWCSLKTLDLMGNLIQKALADLRVPAFEREFRELARGFPKRRLSSL